MDKKFKVIVCDSQRELLQTVNNLGISKNDIVGTPICENGQWIVYYYG